MQIISNSEYVSLDRRAIYSGCSEQFAKECLHSNLSLHSKKNQTLFNYNFVIIKKGCRYYTHIYMYITFHFPLFQTMAQYIKLIESFLKYKFPTLTLWEISRSLLYRRLGPRTRYTFRCTVHITVAPHRTKRAIGCAVWRPRSRLASIWNQRNTLATVLGF